MKQVAVTMMMCLLMGTAFSQNGERKNDRKAALEARKVAFLTRAMELTPEESQSFWPIYNQFHEERKALRKEGKPNLRKANFEELSDKQIEDMMRKGHEIKQQELNLEKSYFDKYNQVISIRQIAKMHQAEKRFQIEVVKQFDKRRDGQRPGGGNGPDIRH